LDALISVIIPVYNVEKYLKRCVDSVTGQTYKNLEIWLVDDGSTDGSGKICNEYAKQDDRVRVIHKENGGQSSARNIALDRASGTWIMNVDSDDFIHPESVKKMYEAGCREEADIVVCRMEQGNNDHFANVITGKPEVKLTGTEVMESIFDDRYRGSMVSACGKLYRSKIFTDIRYPVGRVYEDECVIHRLLDKCKRVVIIEEYLYYQYDRSGSTTRNGYTLKNLQAVQAVEERCSFFENKGDGRLLFFAYRDYMRRVQFHYYSLKKYFPQKKTERQQIKSHYKHRYNAIKNDMRWKERLRYGLFLWMPNINRFLKRLMGARAI